MADVQARALYDFESGGGGELAFTADEVLTIIRQDIGDGWWEAKNSRGETGLIPEAYMEMMSLPEPSMPPPPPPVPVASYQNNNNWSSPASSPSWNPPQQNNWNQPVQPAAPPSLPAQPTAPPVNDQGRQESYEDWDDDWDDDDSSTTTETPSEFGGPGNFGLAPANRDGKGGKDDASKFGTVKKSFNRFSAFSKQGGDAYLFGTAVANVPESDKLHIVDTPDGPKWKPLDHLFNCVIASPKKESKYHGMKSFIAYQITPSFSNIQVSRRYKHFDWLHKQLGDKFTAIVVPPLPDKQISGRYEEDFIQERMRQLQLWVDRMCQHPVIAHSEVFHHFMSCTDEKRWKVGKRKAEKDEFQGGKFFLTIQTPATSLDSQDVENKLERFSRFVKSMDDSVRHLANVGESNMKKHQAFKKEFQKLGMSFISLAKSFEFDERPVAQPLTIALENTGKTYDSIGKLYEDQPRYDMQFFLEGLHEYKGILSVFPDVIGVQRAASQKMEESFTKLSESEAQTAQGRVDVISYATMAEMNNFDQHRVGDFKKMMQDYLRQQIQFYQKVTSLLEGALQEYDKA